MKQLKVLVIDDDEVDRLAVRRALKLSMVLEAKDAASALELLAQGPVDVVLLDYFLPPDTGPEVLQRLLVVQPGLPCIFLSGKGTEEIAVEAMKAGAEDYLPKAAIADEGRLKQLIKRTLEAGQLRSQVHRERTRCSLALEASGASTWVLEDATVTGDDTFRALFSLPEGAAWPIAQWLSTFTPPDAKRLGEALKAPAVSLQAQLVGTPRWVELRGRRDDRSRHTIGTVMDITPSKAAEARTLALKDRLMGIASHDLKNPLSTVTMGARLLSKSERLDEKEQRLVENISASARRMSSLIAQLLDLTRVRLAGGLPLEKKPVPLAALVEALVEQTRLGTGRAIETTLAPVTVDADPDRLSQVVSNLLDNAVKHGDPQRPIEVSVRADQGRARIEVANHGSLIEAPVLEALFEPFAQGQGAAREGIGLGLFISREVMQAHGGSLTATSSQGLTRFSAVLLVGAVRSTQAP